MRRTKPSPGQAMVEFALAVIVFLALVMGIVDFGRGIYVYNGVSQAAREVARAASVHPGTPLGSSTAVTGVTDTQRRLVPGLQNPLYTCLDATTLAEKATACLPGDLVRVDVSAPFALLTPMLGSFGPFTLNSSSTVEIQ